MNNEEIKVQSDQGYYLGVKLIKARKAWRINGSAIVYDMNRMVQHDDVVDEGYEVEYPDGYKSFSPKDVFEKAYYQILDPTKISEGDVLGFMKQGYSLRLGEKTTVVLDTAITGFDTIGTSACVNPNNYDHAIGEGIARRDIKDKIWGHLGFVLQWAINGLKR
jgi:hypothetical protein